MERHQYRKIALRNRIDVPYIPPEKLPYYMTGDISMLPTVKYLVITKVQENQITKRIHKKMLIRRKYGVGILTTKNEYYYNELVLRACLLKYHEIDQFCDILLDRFIYTRETKIVITDKVDKKSEPISLFIKLIAKCYKIQFHTTTFRRMLKAINTRRQLVIYKNFNKYRFGPITMKKVIDKIFERKLLAFIRDPDWREKVESMKWPSRNAAMESAIGILYMYDLQIRKENNIRWRKKRLERQKKIEEEMQQAQLSSENNGII